MSESQPTSLASDGSNYVELDAAIIKDDEFESLLKSLAPKANAANSNGFKFDESQLAKISETMQSFFSSIMDDISIENHDASIEYDDCDFDDLYYDEEVEHDLDISNDDEFESLLAYLPPVENDTCAYDFNYDAIMQHIVNCSQHHKRTPDDTVSDIYDMVGIGLTRGDVRKDQLRSTVFKGAEKIVKLAYWYKIPIRSAPGEKIRLLPNTLTFVRAITRFPHLASIFLHKASEFAKNGAISVLASEQLPDAMKHCGFCGLIPKCCDSYLMKAYLFAHTAYMIDLGKLINPGDKRSLKALAASQLEYSKAAVEKFPYDDQFRVGILSDVGLTDVGVFKNIVDVCNNLCKVVGEPELTFATAEKCHVKNNKICFFEGDSKDVAADEIIKSLSDELRVVSIHDSSSSTA